MFKGSTVAMEEEGRSDQDPAQEENINCLFGKAEIPENLE